MNWNLRNWIKIELCLAVYFSGFLSSASPGVPLMPVLDARQIVVNSSEIAVITANSSVVNGSAVAFQGAGSTPALATWILAGIFQAKIMLVKVAIITLKSKSYTYPIAVKVSPSTLSSDVQLTSAVMTTVSSTVLKSNSQLTSTIVTSAWNTGISKPISYSLTQSGVAVPNFAYTVSGYMYF